MEETNCIEVKWIIIDGPGKGSVFTKAMYFTNDEEDAYEKFKAAQRVIESRS